MASATRNTLPGVAYHSDETYAVDKERVFYRNWIYVGRAERVARSVETRGPPLSRTTLAVPSLRAPPIA